jgi:hypothetical protein
MNRRSPGKAVLAIEEVAVVDERLPRLPESRGKPIGKRFQWLSSLLFIFGCGQPRERIAHGDLDGGFRVFASALRKFFDQSNRLWCLDLQYHHIT